MDGENYADYICASQSLLVEVDDKVLIFDYFDGDKVDGWHFTGRLPHYKPDTKIYMFASHSHKDHFDLDIFKVDRRISGNKIHFLKPDTHKSKFS